MEKLPTVGGADFTKVLYNKNCKEVKISFRRRSCQLKTAVLLMKRASLAQGLICKSALYSDIRLVYEPDYAKANQAILQCQAQAALLEITEGEQCSPEYCLGLCSLLRRTAPECRLLLMCPEHDAAAVEDSIRAKRQGLVDDFVFYDVSMDYLLTSLRSL